jgi:pimeloyl-ACP methyl ester carboxylesterase
MWRTRFHFQLFACLACLAVSARGTAGDKPAYDSFDVKGVKIRYLVQGAGEPVVLIHGLYSSADTNWRLPGTVNALAKNRKVVALDLPGHGGSDKPDKEEAYGLQMVEDVVLLLDRLKIKKAHIVGYSMGGMVALKFIERHPERVLSGTLGGMGWLKDGGMLQKVWEQMPVRAGSPTPAACVNSLGKLAITETALKAIKTPVAILVGDKDPVKKMYISPLQSVRKDWRVTEIEGAGHFNCIMKKQFVDELVKWVNANSVK